MQNKLEVLNKCVYCQSCDIVKVFSAPNRFSKNTELFSVLRCRSCNVVFQNPRVREEFIGDFYSDDLHYYKPNANPELKGLREKIKFFLYKHALINHFNYIHLGSSFWLLKVVTKPFCSRFLVQLLPSFKARGVLLDIGCAHGANLKKLRELGWKVMGLEMNVASGEIARQLGLDVKIGKIEDGDFSSNSFDAVLMGMVLEHLHNPFDSLKMITNWIKPDGQLIFSIPYFDGFEFSWFQEYAYGVQLPHHIVFLNKKVIIDFLTSLGYKNIKFYFQYFDRDVVASAGYKYEDTKLLRYKLLSQSRFVRAFIVRPLVYIMSLFQMTSRVTVYAEKI
jgi:SAM-dependent methyltransferase